MCSSDLDFLAKAFLPIINKLGPKITSDLSRYGFYPAGGGCFSTRIEPCQQLSAIDLLVRGEILNRSGCAIIASLPRSIARRELDTAANLLNWDARMMEVIQTRDSAGPGNILLLEITSSEVTEVFCGFGRLGASAESVAAEAVESARTYLASGAAVSEHLADQLLLPFALAGGGAFTAEKLNTHARTNMNVIKRFLPVDFAVTQEAAYLRVQVNRIEQ